MKASILHRVDRDTLGGLLALVVLASELVGVWRSLNPLLGAWSQPEYSHAWFILPLALLIFVNRFSTIHISDYRLPGVLLAACSIVVTLLGWATGSYTVAIYGALLGIIGFVWSSTGLAGMKSLAAPLIYLFFMVPIPVALYISLSSEMQLLSSKVGMALISLFDVDASLEGNIIILRSAKLEVAEACSGLRYLFPLVSFGFLISMLLDDRFWKKALLVASTFPIAIVTNALRIAGIAVLLDRFNIDTSSGSAHAFEGFAVFFLCMVLLLFEVWFLLGVGSPRGRFAASYLMFPDRGKIQRLMSWPVLNTSLLAAGILLTGTILIASLPERVETIPNRQPLVLFPMKFGEWHGTPKTLDGESLAALGLTDYLLADYADEANASGPLNFYIAYYASQRTGIHAHSPQLCIPGGGWSIIRQSIVTIPSAIGSIVANRVVIEKHGGRQIVYYWFEERGRHIAAESSLKYYALRDALIDNRTDGALVRVVAPISAGNEAATDSLARKLVADASVLLDSYIPGRIQE